MTRVRRPLPSPASWSAIAASTQVAPGRAPGETSCRPLLVAEGPHAACERSLVTQRPVREARPTCSGLLIFRQFTVRLTSPERGCCHLCVQVSGPPVHLCLAPSLLTVLTAVGPLQRPPPPHPQRTAPPWCPGWLPGLLCRQQASGSLHGLRVLGGALACQHRAWSPLGASQELE